MTAPKVRGLIALCATALLGALVLGAAPAGGRARSPAFPPDRPTRVLVLGDSVMLGAAPQDQAALPGREVVVDAAVNRSTRQGSEKIDELGTDWDVVVVMLGHNDGGSPGVYQPAAREIMDKLHDVPRVVWLTIHEARPYYADVNAFIGGMQADYPNMRVGDWNKIANEHPDGMSSDGLHLNGQGADLMAGLVAEQVALAERELGPKPTTTTTQAPTTTTEATTTTTEAPTTTTTEVEALSSVATPPTEQVTQAPVDEPADDGDDAPVALIGGILAVLFVVGIALGIWLSRRRKTRTDADTAG